jgi:hypothetical protein
MRGVVGRTGGQAKTTMHALLNDRVVERSERIMGGAHKINGIGFATEQPLGGARKAVYRKSFRD